MNPLNLKGAWTRGLSLLLSLLLALCCALASTAALAGATTTALSVTPNPAGKNQTVTLTAIVSGTSPTGTVTFKDGSTTLGTSTLSGTTIAVFTTSFGGPGTKSLKATYNGDAGNTASTSATVSLVVNTKANTTTTLLATANPATVNQSVTLSATVLGNNPGGTVTFKNGTTTLGTGTLVGGVADLATTFTSTGTKSLTASYGGNSSNNTSTSATLSLSVNAALSATTTSLSSSVNPSTVGQSTTLSATVAPATASGTVTFKDGTATLGTGTLASGVATVTTSFTSAGNHTLTASYAGNTSFAASTSAAGTQGVNKASPGTTLAATPNPAIQDAPLVLTATVSGGASPGGSVSFQDGATVLGSASLAAGQATLNTSLSSTGAHSLSASYAGDSNHNTSTSSALSVQVNPAPTLPPPPSSAAPVVNYEYDAQGNPTKTIQAPGVAGFNFATANTYDALNRRKDSTDAKAGVTQFAYNGREDLTQLTDPRNLVTQYPRNGLGDTTQLISPDTGTATHTYDAAGNLLTRTDSRGVLATSSYDALNRLTSLIHSQSGQTSQTQTWTYDQTGAGFANGVGRLTSTSHPAGSTQSTYDPQGRLLTDIQRVTAATGANSAQISTTVGYGYDAAGNVSSIVYPSGRKLSVSYTDGQASALALAKDTASTATNLISAIQWEPFGAPKSWLWQMASSTQAYARVYDSSGRIVRYRLGTSVRDITYDAGDRITAYTHYDSNTAAATPSLDQGFGYDELGRITSVTTATASWSIGYDANGNRTSVTQNASTSVYTTAATSNRLSSITNPARSLGYDSAGNTTSDSAGYTSTYNLAGRMATLTKAGTTTTYSVDGMNRRVRKFSSTGASSTVIFVYDQQGQLLGEYDQGGNAIREYVWLNSTPIALFTPDTVTTNPPLVYYFHTDHLDAPRVAVDKSNGLRWRWLAEPFGTSAPENNPQSLGAFTQPLRFPGQYADSESGLNYNVNRDYDGSLGRYVQSDPIGLAGGINTYAYAEGQPTSLIDPLGLTTYMCTQPLHGLGDKWGPRLYPESRFNPSPFFHQYVCVPDEKGGMSCGGQDRAEKPFGPGKPSTDTYKPESCKPVDEKQCVEQCLLTEINNPNRPTYALFGGGGRNAGAQNCQQWADQKVQQCQQQCKAK